MKRNGVNLKKHNFKYSCIILFLIFCCFFSLGYSSWYVGSNVEKNNLEIKVSGVFNSTKYITVNPNYGDNTGIEKLNFNSSGFVYDDIVSYVGHLKYHLIFDSKLFFEDSNYENRNINFRFELMYVDDNVGTNSLINQNYLTATLEESSTNFSRTLNLSFVSHTTVYAETDYFIITSESDKMYLTLDYIFNVQNSDNYENIKDHLMNENGITMALITYLGGGF